MKSFPGASKDREIIELFKKLVSVAATLIVTLGEAYN